MSFCKGGRCRPGTSKGMPRWKPSVSSAHCMHPPHGNKKRYRGSRYWICLMFFSYIPLFSWHVDNFHRFFNIRFLITAISYYRGGRCIWPGVRASCRFATELFDISAFDRCRSLQVRTWKLTMPSSTRLRVPYLLRATRETWQTCVNMSTYLSAKNVSSAREAQSKIKCFPLAGVGVTCVPSPVSPPLPPRDCMSQPMALGHTVFNLDHPVSSDRSSFFQSLA